MRSDNPANWGAQDPQPSEPVYWDALGLEEVRRLLWGKSHYFDANTMRGFGSRLLSAQRWGQTLLTLVRDKKPGEGLVYSAVRFDLETGQATRIEPIFASKYVATKTYAAEICRIESEETK